MASTLKLCYFFLIVICLIFETNNVFAGSKYNSQSGHKDFCVTVRNSSGSVTNEKCQDVRVSSGLTDSGDYFTLVTGAPVGGATSMTSDEKIVPTSYTYVRKALTNDPAYATGTLADGTAGQLLTIHITEAQNNSSWTLTPSRKTGFTSLLFESVGDRMTLLYVDDTVGWIPIISSSVQINP